MSLDWNLTKIENHETVCFYKAIEASPDQGIAVGDRLLKPETDVIIWLTMFTGIGWEVTDENIDEFVYRVQFYERLHGPMLRARDEETGTYSPAPLSEETIRAHKGISTNVSHTPRGEWMLEQFEVAFPKAEKLSERAQERLGL